VRRNVRAWRLEIAARHFLERPARGPWQGAALYHAPDVVYPPVRGMPVVMTVHDLSYVVYPRYHTRFNGMYLRLMTPVVARHATLVIAVSAATARDLVERVGVPERKLRVVYQSIAATFLQPPAPEAVTEVRKRYGLAEPFLLSVGTLEPRKNLAGTLAAYRLLRERVSGAPLLALAGGAGWRVDEEILLDTEDAAYVRRLGFVPDEDLAALYASCSAFVYPSLYEGWGLPVAEAMAFGAPTVTSTVSSLPEVAGDAALLVDPRRPEEIAAALERLLVDSAATARLRAAGPVQARRFSTESWAANTLRVYEEAAGT
jgi:glycosyltransferase involved in cell wall biosynthesis